MIIKTSKYLPLYILLSFVGSFSVEAATIKQKINGKIYNIPKLQQDLVIDGNIDEKAWQQALMIELTIETKPGENTKAPVKTTAYMFEDGESIYVAFKAYDHDISKIRAHYHDHDLIFDDDIVGFKVDTFNDSLHAYQFFINPLGVKHDSIEDTATGEDDISWNAIWDAASKITEDGFYVEFAVPLKILRFDDSKDEQIWGFDLLRFYPREDFHRISYHKVDRNISCNLCQNDKIKGLKDIKTGKDLTIVPFMTAAKNESRDKPLTDQWQSSSVDADFGADLRWGVTPDTTINATINPDFSQVESDVAQLDNNNTFSLFFPEKRQFFVEGADYYQSLINVVHTRNISDPDYGMKVTHSSNGNNYAAFFSNDTQTNYVLPGSLESNLVSLSTDSTNGVIRYRHDLENTSTFGAIMTIRKSDNYHNYVYGIDGSFRLSDTDVIRAQLLNSDTEDPDSTVTEFSLVNSDSSGTAADLHYKHQSRDWTIWGRYTRLDEGFRADLGFQPRVDYNRYIAGVRRFWFNNDSWWNTVSAGFDTRYSYDLNGDVIENWLTGTVEYLGIQQSQIEIEYTIGEESWAGTVYDTNEIEVSGKVTIVSGVVTKLNASYKDTIDYVNAKAGELFSISPSVTLNLGQHFQTEIQYTQQKM
ncbi:MAG: carbohydrate binding family 9 domain-containing protein, partial [Gammaproteobacteria bacterium]|nr:carbohydrate binding family 9 domain-containing protein [Gammaproteobacteria bacterium]